MEVMIPTSAMDFPMEIPSTTPYTSAPSTPQRVGPFFFSAPTSPARVSAFYDQEFNESHHSLPSSVPFHWEEKPGIPKAKENYTMINRDDDDDESKEFAFDFSAQLEMGSVLSAADELFDGGKIKPLKPPPRLQNLHSWGSPKSPRSPKEMIREALSPKPRKKDFDPFEAALEQTRIQELPPKRGRQSTSNSMSRSTSSRKKGTRSLSPVLRVSDLLLDPPNDQNIQDHNTRKNSSPFPSSSFGSFWYRKWKLKDLLLFRSASEGRAASKSEMKKREMEDVKDSSFRSENSIGSVSSSKRRGPVSAHELHYKANRAVSVQMRKQTFLPYKSNLLGCLGFNSAVHVHAVSKGLASMSRAHGY